MAAQIKDNCTSCGACEPLCPTSSIKKGDPRYVIDSDSCELCGICIPVCPVGAIYFQKIPVAPQRREQKLAAEEAKAKKAEAKKAEAEKAEAEKAEKEASSGKKE